LVFRAPPEVAARADWKSMKEMADTLITSMKERGVAAYMPLPNVAAPAPRIEIFVRHWEARDTKTHLRPSTAAILVGGAIGAGVQLAHARDVEVDCAVVREGESGPFFRHHFVASTGDEVAEHILDRIFTEKPDTGADQPRHMFGPP
jgi:hypothetical protein